MKNKIPLLTLQNFSLAYTREVLIKPFSISIYEKQRYCLVGRNGCGKSSLLKAIGGDYDHIKGDIIAKGSLGISYLAQKEDYPLKLTAAEFIQNSLSIEELENKIFEVSIFLDIFKIKPDLQVSELSGGNQRRLSLIKSLIKDADILLLDEPTNHLDVTTIEWLEIYLSKRNGALITISHDREFLNNTTNNTIWIDKGQVFTNSHGFIAYENWSEQIIQDEITKLQKLTKEVEKENLWLHQGVTARRKRNQHRLRKVYSLREKLSLGNANLKNRYERISLKDMENEQSSKIAVDMSNVNFSYEGKESIINNFNLRIIHGDKIGIIGENGSGKSTLIKLIIEEVKPNHGVIYYGPKTRVSYFEQDRKSLDTSKTPWEILCPSGGDQVQVGDSSKHVMGYLKDFMFTSEKAKTITEALSGGEQNRLMLAKALANPGNFLILDEPTNDLDTDTLDMLLEILSDFEGTVVVVSHDRDFLEKLVTRTIIFEGGKIIENYGGYLDYKKSKEQKKPTGKASANNMVHKATKEAGNHFSYKYKLELEELNKSIPKLEDEIGKLEKDLTDPNLYSKDPNKFLATTSKLDLLKLKLSRSETRWLELESMREA